MCVMYILEFTVASMLCPFFVVHACNIGQHIVRDNGMLKHFIIYIMNGRVNDVTS